MRYYLFILLCATWFDAKAAMVAIAPLAEHVVWFSGLFCLGHILMTLLVHKFPAGLKPKTSVMIIIISGVLARLGYMIHS